jgi:hypothetical protein
MSRSSFPTWITLEFAGVPVAAILEMPDLQCWYSLLSGSVEKPEMTGVAL